MNAVCIVSSFLLPVFLIQVLFHSWLVSLCMSWVPQLILCCSIHNSAAGFKGNYSIVRFQQIGYHSYILLDVCKYHSVLVIIIKYLLLLLDQYFFVSTFVLHCFIVTTNYQINQPVKETIVSNNRMIFLALLCVLAPRLQVTNNVICRTTVGEGWLCLSIVAIMVTGEKRSILRTLSATFSVTNSKYTSLKFNPCFRGERPEYLVTYF